MRSAALLFGSHFDPAEWAAAIGGCSHGQSLRGKSSHVSTFQPLFTLLSLTSHWSQQITWRSPKSTYREVYFTHLEARQEYIIKSQETEELQPIIQSTIVSSALPSFAMTVVLLA